MPVQQCYAEKTEPLCEPKYEEECHQVPVQDCKTTYKESCVDEPKEVCSPYQGKQCRQVPMQVTFLSLL